VFTSAVPVFRQINQVHTTPFCLSNIHLNITHPPKPWSSLWSISFWLFDQYLKWILPPYIRATCPAHPPRLDHSNYAWRREKDMRLLICNFIQPHLT
jgi:hypothetical protein